MVLAPPPARLSIAPFFPPLLRRMICFLRHRPWYLLPITPSPKPVVQLLVRNRHPQFLLTPSHRLSYRPKPPLPTPPPPLSAFASASIPMAPLPNLCLPTSSIPPASYHFTHRYAHALCPPPLSPASIAPLAVTSPAPVISWLSEHLLPACKAGETLLAGCFQAVCNGHAIPT